MKTTITQSEVDQLKAFVQRWTDKAVANAEGRENDPAFVFDKFISLYIAYAGEINALKKKNNSNYGDTKRCTECAAQCLTAHDSSILNRLEPSAERFFTILRENYVVGRKRFRISNSIKKDKEQILKWDDNTDPKIRLEALLLLLYRLRCNTFHGSKEFLPIQVPILQAASQCMEIINCELLSYIETLVV